MYDELQTYDVIKIEINSEVLKYFQRFSSVEFEIRSDLEALIKIYSAFLRVRHR